MKHMRYSKQHILLSYTKFKRKPTGSKDIAGMKTILPRHNCPYSAGLCGRLIEPSLELFTSPLSKQQQNIRNYLQN